MLGLTSLSGLISPILVAGGILLGIAITDTQEVYIRELSVPPSFTRIGYTAAVVSARIHDELLTLERTARTRRETRRLATQADKTSLELIAEYMNITLVARAIQDASRLTEYAITAAVVEERDAHVMNISIRHRSGTHFHLQLTRPSAEVDELLQDAAAAILQVIEPHILCMIRLREGLAQAPRTIEPARQCIQATLVGASRADRIWLFNLLGVVSFMRRDQLAATNAFRAALQIDSDFSPSLLNLGIMLALNGRHDDAIRAYRYVFRRATVGESPQTYAATYAEWGNSLMALGRPREARERYADAVRADPRYALAYFSWADSLPPGPAADELRRRGSLAQRLDDQLYAENLVGVLRDTRVSSPTD